MTRVQGKCRHHAYLIERGNEMLVNHSQQLAVNLVEVIVVVAQRRVEVSQLLVALLWQLCCEVCPHYGDKARDELQASGRQCHVLDADRLEANKLQGASAKDQLAGAAVEVLENLDGIKQQLGGALREQRQQAAILGQHSKQQQRGPKLAL